MFALQSKHFVTAMLPFYIFHKLHTNCHQQVVLGMENKPHDNNPKFWVQYRTIERYYMWISIEPLFLRDIHFIEISVEFLKR